MIFMLNFQLYLRRLHSQNYKILFLRFFKKAQSVVLYLFISRIQLFFGIQNKKITQKTKPKNLKQFFLLLKKLNRLSKKIESLQFSTYKNRQEKMGQNEEKYTGADQGKKEYFYMQANRTRVILAKSYHKILYLYPAVNETFVFLGMLGLRQDCVTHMDKKGNVLFEHVFQKPMDAFGMLCPHQAIMLQTRGNTITTLNLLTHTFKKTPHHYFNQQSDQSTILTFAQTSYLCIMQQGRYNDNRFKLSYYTYPLDQQSKPFNVYEAKDNQWTYEYQIKKANQHSMVAWFKPRHDEEWEFRTYDVRDNVKGKLTIYRFPQQIGIQYGMQKVQLGLCSLWQATRHKFILVCISNKTDHEINKHLGVIQNIYICETKTGTIRQAGFGFGKHHDYLIDYYNLGRFCMFRTFGFEGGKALETPVFYVSNESERVLVEEKWECSYLHKYEFPGYDGDMMIENLYENGDCEWFECIEKKFWNHKESMLHIMLQLNSDFDENLLHQAMEIIDYTTPN